MPFAGSEPFTPRRAVLFALAGSASAWLGLSAILLTAADQSATILAPPSGRSAQHSPAAAAPRDFQPGIRIDWTARTVLIDAVVVLREGPLEFLACFPGKEHESILRIEAAAVHVYQALGLIGLEPGRPPRWDEAAGTYRPAEGDLVEVHIRAEGREAPAYAWLSDLEYHGPLPSRSWVFAGSIRTADGGLAAQQSGAGIALVDFGDSLLSMTRLASSSDSELWAQAETSAIPAPGTRVELALRPARPGSPLIELDFRGDLRMDGRYVRMGDFLDWLGQQLRLAPDEAVTIRAGRALEGDRSRLLEKLRRAGVSERAITLAN